MSRIDDLPLGRRRAPMLKVNRPQLVADGGAVSSPPWEWMLGRELYPDQVRILYRGGERCSADQGCDHTAQSSTWETWTLRVEGYGMVVVGCSRHADGDCCSLSELPIVDPELMRLIGCNGLAHPVDWWQLSAARHALSGTRRVRGMLLGVAAFVGLTRPELWGDDPGVPHTWSRRWMTQDGVPMLYPAQGLDLRDPTSWA